MRNNKENRMLPRFAAMLALAVPPWAGAEQQVVSAEQVVDALEHTFGVHPGQRRNHIKGTCALGEFVGSSAAGRFTRSPLFSGKAIPVVARFSMPGGNPKIPDHARVPRGLALEFRLDDGSLQHMTMLNTPVFGAATPQTFLNDIVAKTPDPATGKPDPERIKAFKASHPDSHAQAEYLAAHNPPSSWGNSSYFGIHAFKFINADQATTLVRWRFVPRQGEQRLSNEALASAPADFLEQKLIEQTREQPLLWDMVLTIGQAGDADNNPTQAWPAGREEVTVGTLSITSAMPQQGGECEQINYDPLVMSDGIEPTDDPVLLFRSAAYAISFAKRQSGQ